MRDAAGKTIQVGDKLFYGQTSRYACFGFVEVLSMTPKGLLRCKWVKHDRWYPITDEVIIVREGDHCVIVDRPVIAETKEVLTDMFNNVNGLITYWDVEEAANLKTQRDRLEGLVFSIFSMLDGNGGTLMVDGVELPGPLHELWCMYNKKETQDV